MSMTRMHEYVNRAGRFLCLMTAVIGLSACSRTISFEEEVEISPGEIIVITRGEKHVRACEAFSCGWGFEKAFVSAPFPKMTNWEAGLWPLLLSKDNKGRIALIAASVFAPCPYYRQFTFVDGAWNETSVANEFFGKEANLLIPGRDEFESKVKKISLSEKKKRNSRAGLADYSLRVLRKPTC